MKLKGAYDASTNYSVGDIVKFNDRWYFMEKAPGAAGYSPADTRYWNLKDPAENDILDLLDQVFGDLETLYPDPKNIVLASSTASSTKKFKIKVVNDGTISATEVS